MWYYNYTLTEEELMHHGVKGMKWGVIRTPAQLGHKPPKSKRLSAKASKTRAKAKVAKAKAAKAKSKYMSRANKTDWTEIHAGLTRNAARKYEKTQRRANRLDRKAKRLDERSKKAKISEQNSAQKQKSQVEKREQKMLVNEYRKTARAYGLKPKDKILNGSSEQIRKEIERLDLRGFDMVDKYNAKNGIYYDKRIGRY